MEWLVPLHDPGPSWCRTRKGRRRNWRYDHGDLASRRTDARLRGRQAKAEDVQLLFIPDEFEDVARWQAAAIEAVKKNPAEPYRSLVEPSGTGRVYVKLKGSIVDMVNARGGPSVTVKDFGGHTADPTTAGTWTLGAGKSVVTTSWDTRSR